MKTIRVVESRSVIKEETEKEYSYKDIRDLFGDTPGCLVMRLLERVEELEADNALLEKKLQNALNAILIGN